MGFLKKIFKGIKKVFKKIGRGIKKGFAKFGKFMNKIGIVGQIAMMFILPGIGGALMKGLGTLGATLSASSSLILQGAGAVLNGAMKFATSVGNAYRTVTNGIMDFGKTALNKIPGVDLKLSGSGTWLENMKTNAQTITEPWKKTIVGKGRTLSDISKTTGVSVEDLASKNYDIRGQLGDDPSKWGDFKVGQDAEIWTQTAKPMKILEDQAFDIDVGEMVKSAPSTSIQPVTEGTSYEMASPVSKDAPSLLADTAAPEKYPTDPKYYAPEGTIPESKGLVSDFYEGAKAELRDRYTLKKPLQTLQTVQSDLARFQKPEVDMGAAFGGGYVVDVGQYSVEDFQAVNTVVTPFLQQLQKDSGVFGYSAYLDDQISYNQRMIQENQRRFNLGSGQ